MIETSMNALHKVATIQSYIDDLYDFYGMNNDNIERLLFDIKYFNERLNKEVLLVIKQEDKNDRAN